jgi:peptidyl-prolyl cis-trans isomerase D
MLQAIRNRAQGIFAWVILILIGVPFALWGIQNYFDSGKEQPVAVVGDRDIFERDVNRAYEQNLANLVGVEFDEKQLKRETLNRLINEELIVQSAEDDGLALSDGDVRAFVQSLPYFQTDGKFDKEKYKLMLSSQGINPAQFAAQIRRSLTMEQYQRGVTETAFVTKQQLEAFYRLRNEQRQIEYFTVPLKRFTGDIPEKDIDAYYQENLAAFQNPERVSVEYLSISLEDIARTIRPTEEELKNLYEEQKAQYTTAEQRKVSHILVAVESDKDAADKAALAKATQLRERLIKGENFSVVAKDASDDKASAEKGGDLGFINQETVDPNFAKTAFALATNEISQPVKTPFGYHIIKVTELVPGTTKTFEQVREELAQSFQRSAAENKFYDLGQTLTEQSFEHPDTLEPAAKALNLKIAQTALFTRDAGEGVAAEQKVREAAFSQDVLDGRNSEPVEIGNEKVIVLRMKEHDPASNKPLAEVKQEIIEKLRDNLGRAEARKRAERLLAEVNQGKAMADVAKAAGFALNKPPAVQRNATNLPAALVTAAFGLAPSKAGKAGAALAELDTGDQVVFSLLGVTDGSVGTVDPKELDMARAYLAKGAGQSEFAAFVTQLREHADVYIKPQE